MEIKILKPIYETETHARVGIREKIIKEAIKKGEYLKIIVPKGEAVVDPVKVLREGERYEQVFKFPESPMVLYHFCFAYNSKPEPKVESEEEKLRKLSLSTS